LQIRALRWIAKYQTAAGGMFHRNTIVSLAVRRLVRWDFDAPAGGTIQRTRIGSGAYIITDLGREALRQQRDLDLRRARRAR
jgi:hypothetical protein